MSLLTPVWTMTNTKYLSRFVMLTCMVMLQGATAKGMEVVMQPYSQGITNATSEEYDRYSHCSTMPFIYNTSGKAT